MKKVILLIMMLAAGKLYAQVAINHNPNIIYKLDTTRFLATNYKMAPRSKVAQLLQKMEGFEVVDDSLVTNQGQPVEHVRINGKHYDGMTVQNVISRLPVEVVANIEMIDNYGDQAAHVGGGKSGKPDKLLNINLKPGYIINLHGFADNDDRPPRPQYLPAADRRITNMGTYRLRNSDEFNIADRSENSRRITRQIEQLQFDIEFQGRETNLYGDVMPHFLPGYAAWPGPGPAKKKKVVVDSVRTVKAN